jgi:hypothetical protein
VTCPPPDDPRLAGRVARCAYGCGNTTPSDHPTWRPFFEYLGEGSREATNLCTCGYSEVVHHPINTTTGRPGVTDHPFTPKGGRDTDRYYCGCRGWD